MINAIGKMKAKFENLLPEVSHKVRTIIVIACVLTQFSSDYLPATYDPNGTIQKIIGGVALLTSLYCMVPVIKYLDLRKK